MGLHLSGSQVTQLGIGGGLSLVARLYVVGLPARPRHAPIEYSFPPPRLWPTADLLIVWLKLGARPPLLLPVFRCRRGSHGRRFRERPAGARTAMEESSQGWLYAPLSPLANVDLSLWVSGRVGLFVAPPLATPSPMLKVSSALPGGFWEVSYRQKTIPSRQ